MKRTFGLYLALIFSYCILTSCRNAGEQSAKDNDYSVDQQTDTAGKYKNPVFEPVLADPTVVRTSDGWFYAYGTEDAWDNGPDHLVAIVKSKDLIHWTYLKDAFLQKPDWKSKGGIWAPDVTYFNDQYYMYYAFSVWGDPNPGIGLAISEQPEGPFVDQGKVFLSEEIGVPNSIDPFFYREGDKNYLFWGSFHGIYGIELSNDGTQTMGEKFRIAGNDFEGTYIYKRDNYYYFFGSSGSCCEGANSTYYVTVARSKNMKGPYMNKVGQNIMNNKGSLLIKGNDTFAGPGHNAEIIEDDNSDTWFLYHAIDKAKPHLPKGATRRPLMLDKLEWDDDGWPMIAGGTPSTKYLPMPVFK